MFFTLEDDNIATVKKTKDCEKILINYKTISLLEGGSKMNNNYDSNGLNNMDNNEPQKEKDPSVMWGGEPKDSEIRERTPDTQYTASPYKDSYQGAEKTNQQPAQSGGYESGSYNPRGSYHSGGNSSYTWSNGAVTPNVSNSSQQTYQSGQSYQGYYGQTYKQPYEQPLNQTYNQAYQGNTQVTPPNKPKKKKKHTGLKIIAALMCCVMISFSSVGAFVLMIQNGVVNIDQGESTNPAFTINKIIDNESTTSATNMGTGVTLLTTQQVAEKMIPSVVCIQTYTTQTQQSMYYGNFFGYGRGSEGEQEPEDALYSQGSGIIYSEDGYIITNAHVIANADKIKVITSDGNTYEGKVIGSDEATDLAVIKIEATGLTAAEFGSSDDLRVGDEVMAIGNPGGIEFNSTVTMGYVSALDRQVQSDESSGYSLACIQTDAAINPGNSGGALVNMYGQVVGINSSKIVATGYEGLGFAIPVDTAQPIITDLMNHGYVKDRAVLGISGEYIDSMSAQFYGLSAGLYVYSANSEEAIAAGLQRADVITAIDDTQVTSLSVVQAYLANKKPGDSVTITVERALSGETLTMELVLSENNGSQSAEADG